MAAESTTNLSYQVSEIKSLMQDLRKQVQKLGEDGKGVVEVFKKIGDPFALQSKSIEELSAKIKEAKAEIVKNQAIQEKSGKQTSEAAAQQTASLNKLIGLEDQLQRAKGAVVREVQNVAKAEQKTRSLKQKGFEDEFNANSKIKSDNLELSAGETEINRILREKAANTASLNEEVYKRQEAEKAAIASEKEGAILKKKSLKEQEALERFMLEKSLKAQADKAIADEAAASKATERKKQEVAEFAKAEKEKALKAIEQSKKDAEANDKLALTKIRTSKLTVNRRAKLENNYWTNLQKRYTVDSTKYKELEESKLKATQRYEKERAGVTKKFRSTRVSPSAEQGGFLSQFKEGLFSKTIGKTLGRLAGVGGIIQIAAKTFQLLKKGIVDSFKASVQFEAQLAQLQAVTGVSNDELNQLSKSVLSVAGSTTFTSEEIVKLQTELGKLGFSSDQIVAATAGIARTAQALGESVGPVAQKIGQILKQYNLDASETEKVSDILVSTINSSALSFEGLGTAIQYVGPLAATAGTEFRDTAAAMAILADNGFTASRIGTGLRGILTELSKTGKDLNTVIRDLSDEEISFSNAIDLVGKRNAAQLISLVENIDALEDSTNKYYQVGSAAVASAQQIDTYTGNVQLLQSAFNKLQIEFGNTIKNSGLVRFALRLIDEEGGKAAESARQLSQINLTDFSASLGEAADSLLELESFSDKDIQLKAEDIIEKDLLKNLQNEVAEIAKERQAIFDSGSARPGDFGKVTTLNFDMKLSPLLEEEISRVDEINKRVKFIVDIIGRGSEQTLSNLKESVSSTIELLREAIEQAKIELERKKIQEEYNDLLTADRRLRDDNLNLQIKELKKGIENTDNLKEKLRLTKELEALEESRIDTLTEGIDFNLKQEARVEEINIRIKNEKEKLVDLDGEAYVLAQARIKQLEQEKKNFNNLIFSRDDLFKLAQKEYELEFKQLANKTNLEKESLKTKEEEIKLRIKTLDNQLKGNLSEEEKKQILENQVSLQNELLVVQDKSRQTIQGYLDEVNEKLQTQKTLWESQGYDLRLLDKALERLEQFQLINDKLAIDFPEFKAAAEGLATTFNKEFGNQLSKGIPLTDAQKEKVRKSLTDLYTKFGISEKDLSASQKKLLEEYLLSTLEIDPQKGKDKTKELLELALGELADASKAYNATALENTQNRLNQELDAIRNRYKTEEQILKSQLDNQLITESQFRAKSEELRKKQLQEENDIQQQIFEAQKKNDLINIGIDTAEAVASNALKNFGTAPTPAALIQTAIGNAIIIASGAAKADAIRRRKFFPAKFEEGGIVNGPSHREGGVPFSVQGQGGYEMEGGEFVVNKRASMFHRSLLERINSSVKPNTNVSQLKFADGGLVSARRATQVNVNNDTKESVNYLKAIANATLSTASDMKKPVRAFVSSKDLTNDETSRRLRERNDRI